MDTETNTPEKKFSTGVISATIWKNQGTKKDGSVANYNTISLQRRYRDKSGEWHSTNSFRVGDLPKAMVVLNKAYEYLVLREQPDLEDEDNLIVVEDII